MSKMNSVLILSAAASAQYNDPCGEYTHCGKHNDMPGSERCFNLLRNGEVKAVCGPDRCTIETNCVFGTRCVNERCEPYPPSPSPSPSPYPPSPTPYPPSPTPYPIYQGMCRVVDLDLKHIAHRDSNKVFWNHQKTEISCAEDSSLYGRQSVEVTCDTGFLYYSSPHGERREFKGCHHHKDQYCSWNNPTGACDYGRVCIDGTCVEPIPVNPVNPGYCYNNDSCPDKEMCIHGQCQIRYCYEVTDCPGDWVCDWDRTVSSERKICRLPLATHCKSIETYTECHGFNHCLWRNEKCLDRDPRFNGPSDDSQGGSFFGATLPVAPESSEEQNLVKGGSFFGATEKKAEKKIVIV